MIDMRQIEGQGRPVYWTEFRFNLLEKNPSLNVLVQETHLSTRATWRNEIVTGLIDGVIPVPDIEEGMANKDP